MRSESERRIRAAVRAVLSPGVWLVMSVQLAALGLVLYRIAPFESLQAAAEQVPGTLFLLPVLFVAYAYVMGGASRSFAIGTAMVSAQEALYRGREVFSPFLWLVLKILLLGLGCLYALAVIAQIIAVAARSQTLAASILWTAPRILLAVAPFALVYWLPIVFVRKDFRLFPTLRAALQTLWQRFGRSGFLAFLIFFPVAVLWLLPAGASAVLLLAVSLLGQLMAWTAYVYCVESVSEGGRGHLRAP